MNNIVNGVWFGPQLTNIQKLSIRSYIDYGHEFHLYVSEPTSGIPEGTVVHNVSEVYERSLKFIRNSIESDYFRVKLIQRIGGWYVDTDTVCLKHFDFSEPYVFVSEPGLTGEMKDVSLPTTPAMETVGPYINGCIFKAPANCKFLEDAVSFIEGPDPDDTNIQYKIGPPLFQQLISRHGLEQYLKPPCVFDAMSSHEMRHFISGGVKWNFSEKSYAIHLRATFWEWSWRECSEFNPDGAYAPASLFEQLKKKHGVS